MIPDRIFSSLGDSTFGKRDLSLKVFCVRVAASLTVLDHDSRLRLHLDFEFSRWRFTRATAKNDWRTLSAIKVALAPERSRRPFGSYYRIFAGRSGSQVCASRPKSRTKVHRIQPMLPCAGQGMFNSAWQRSMHERNRAQSRVGISWRCPMGPDDNGIRDRWLSRATVLSACRKTKLAKWQKKAESIFRLSSLAHAPFLSVELYLRIWSRNFLHRDTLSRLHCLALPTWNR